MGGEGGSRREGGGVVAVGQLLQKRMGLRIVLGALGVAAVVGLSLAIALPATQAAEQVSDPCQVLVFLSHINCAASEVRDSPL